MSRFVQLIKSGSSRCYYDEGEDSPPNLGVNIPFQLKKKVNFIGIKKQFFCGHLYISPLYIPK